MTEIFFPWGTQPSRKNTEVRGGGGYVKHSRGNGGSKVKRTLSTSIHYIHWLANRLWKYFNEWVNGMRTCNVIEPLVSRLQLKRRLMRKIMIVLNRKKVKKLNLLQTVKKTRRK